MTNWDLYFSSEELAAQTIANMNRYCTGGDAACAATGIDACMVCPFASYARMCGGCCDLEDAEQLEEWLVAEGERSPHIAYEIDGRFVLMKEVDAK